MLKFESIINECMNDEFDRKIDDNKPTEIKVSIDIFNEIGEASTIDAETFSSTPTATTMRNKNTIEETTEQISILTSQNVTNQQTETIKSTELMLTTNTFEISNEIVPNKAINSTEIAKTTIDIFEIPNEAVIESNKTINSTELMLTTITFEIPYETEPTETINSIEIVKTTTDIIEISYNNVTRPDQSNKTMILTELFKAIIGFIKSTTKQVAETDKITMNLTKTVKSREISPVNASKMNDAKNGSIRCLDIQNNDEIVSNDDCYQMSIDNSSTNIQKNKFFLILMIVMFQALFF
jgi:hypothetical protein